MTLLLFCMTIMRAPTMPSPDSGDWGGAASGVSVTYNTHQNVRGVSEKYPVYFLILCNVIFKSKGSCYYIS